MIPELLETATVYADAVTHEARLRMQRDDTESTIAASLLGQPNPATNKPHSASSAAEAAKATPEVLALREQIIEAERRVILTRARYECARLSAWAVVRLPEVVP